MVLGLQVICMHLAASTSHAGTPPAVPSQNYARDQVLTDITNRGKRLELTYILQPNLSISLNKCGQSTFNIWDMSVEVGS